MRYIILFLFAALSVITSCTHEPFEPTPTVVKDTVDHRNANEKQAGTYIGQMNYSQNSRMLENNVYVDTRHDTSYPYKIVIEAIGANKISFGSYFFDLGVDNKGDGHYYLRTDVHAYARFRFLSTDSIEYEDWSYSGGGGSSYSRTYRFIGVKQ